MKLTKLFVGIFLAFSFIIQSWADKFNPGGDVLTLAEKPTPRYIKIQWKGLPDQASVAHYYILREEGKDSVHLDSNKSADKYENECYVKISDPAVLSFTDYNIEPGKTYDYGIVVVKNDGTMVGWDLCSFYEVNWAGQLEPTKYVSVYLFRGESPDFELPTDNYEDSCYSKMGGPSQTSFVDLHVEAGKDYYYALVAVGKYGSVTTIYLNSGLGKWVEGKVIVPEIAGGAGADAASWLVTDVITEAFPDKVRLSWKPVDGRYIDYSSGDEKGISNCKPDGYRIYRTTSRGASIADCECVVNFIPADLPKNSKGRCYFDVVDLEEFGKQYLFRVYAVSGQKMHDRVSQVAGWRKKLEHLDSTINFGMTALPGEKALFQWDYVTDASQFKIINTQGTDTIEAELYPRRNLAPNSEGRYSYILPYTSGRYGLVYTAKDNNKTSLLDSGQSSSVIDIEGYYCINSLVAHKVNSFDFSYEGAPHKGGFTVIRFNAIFEKIVNHVVKGRTNILDNDQLAGFEIYRCLNGSRHEILSMFVTLEEAKIDGDWIEVIDYNTSLLGQPENKDPSWDTHGENEYYYHICAVGKSGWRTALPSTLTTDPTVNTPVFSTVINTNVTNLNYEYFGPNENYRQPAPPWFEIDSYSILGKKYISVLATSRYTPPEEHVITEFKICDSSQNDIDGFGYYSLGSTVLVPDGSFFVKIRITSKNRTYVIIEDFLKETPTYEDYRSGFFAELFLQEDIYVDGERDYKALTPFLIDSFPTKQPESDEYAVVKEGEFYATAEGTKFVFSVNKLCPYDRIVYTLEGHNGELYSADEFSRSFDYNIPSSYSDPLYYYNKLWLVKDGVGCSYQAFLDGVDKEEELNPKDEMSTHSESGFKCLNSLSEPVILREPFWNSETGKMELSLAYGVSVLGNVDIEIQSYKEGNGTLFSYTHRLVDDGVFNSDLTQDGDTLFRFSIPTKEEELETIEPNELIDIVITKLVIQDLTALVNDNRFYKIRFKTSLTPESRDTSEAVGNWVESEGWTD